MSVVNGKETLLTGFVLVILAGLAFGGGLKVTSFLAIDCGDGNRDGQGGDE